MLAPVVRVFGCGEVREDFPGNPCHMAPSTVTVNQMARGGLQKDPWHMPTAIWSLRSLACDLVLGMACYTTRFANDSSCGARFASIHRVCSAPSLHTVRKTIHRVAHGSHRFIVCSVCLENKYSQIAQVSTRGPHRKPVSYTHLTLPTILRV